MNRATQTASRTDSLRMDAAGGRTARVRELIATGINVDSKNRKQGMTALHWACEVMGTVETVETLLDAGADINARDKSGTTPLMMAAGGHDATVVRLLLARGADKEAKNKDGMTALMLGAGFGRTAVVKLLCENGAEVNTKDVGGWTPLMRAAYEGHADAVRVLLAHGARVTARADGETALTLAEEKKHMTVSHLLRGATSRSRRKQT